MMQCGQEPAGTFKTMAEEPNIFKPTLNPEDSGKKSSTTSGDNGIKRRLSFSSEKDIGAVEEADTTCEVHTLQSLPDDSNSCQSTAETTEELSPQAENTCLKAKNATEIKDASPEHRLNSKQHSASSAEDKENTAMPSTTITPGRRGNIAGSFICPCLLLEAF